MVDIDTSEAHRLRTLEVIHLRLDTEGPAAPFIVEILCDELVIVQVLLDNARLPQEEVFDRPAAELVKSGSETAIDGATHIGEVFPAVDAVAPVIEPKRAVESLKAAEALFEPRTERLLYPSVCIAVILRLVVELIADDAAAVPDMLHQGTNHLLGTCTVIGVTDVHVLAPAVELMSAVKHGAIADGTCLRYEHNIRALARHPRRYRISRRPHDDAQALLLSRIKCAVDMREIELAALRLHRAPSRFRDTDGIHTRLFDEAHVLCQPLARHVLIVVSCAVKDWTLHMIPPFLSEPRRG